MARNVEYFSIARNASDASTAPCWRVSPERITRPWLACAKLKSWCICRPPICPASSTNTTPPRERIPRAKNRTDSLRTTKAVLFQVHDLLPLRGDDCDRATGLLKSAVHFTQRVTLARAGPAAKQGDKITRPEDSLDGLTLLGIQVCILDRMAGAVRAEPANAVFAMHTMSHSLRSSSFVVTFPGCFSSRR